MAGASWMRVRAEVRAHRGGWVGLIVVVAIGTGIVASAAAAARRTETAFPRLLRATDAAQVLISAGPLAYAAMERDPRVIGSMRAASCMVFAPSRDAGPDEILIGFTPSDPRTAFRVERPRIIAGRLPDPARTDEVFLDPDGARLLRAQAGRRVHMFGAGPDPGDEPFPLDLLVTGIGVTASEVVPTAVLDRLPTIYLTPAYLREHRDQPGCDGSLFRLRPGTDVDALEEDVQRASRAEGGAFFQDLGRRDAKVMRAIRPQATALWLFAGLAGVAAVLVAGQGLARQVGVAGAEDGVLRALGMARRQLVVRSLAHGAIVGAAGGLAGVALAVAASPRAPIGPARLAEPDPGVSANLAILGLALAGAVVVALASVALPAWRSASASAGSVAEATRGTAARPSVLAHAAARAGLPPSAVAGVRMALEPGVGRARVPVRSALGGIAVAILAFVGATTFASSLDRLVTTPRLYGWDWDLAFDAAFGIFPTTLPGAIAADPGVAALAGGISGENELAIDGRGIPTVAVDPIAGEVFPTLIEGRPPREGEIVLGTKTLRRSGRSIGDRVEVTIVRRERAVSMTIVGSAVFPDFSKGSFEGVGLGEGAAVPVATLGDDDLAPGQYSFLLVRLRPGTGRAAARARLQGVVNAASPECAEGGCAAQTDSKPADISTYERVRATPFTLAAVLGLLAVATLAHALGTALARKRRELAILKTLGFVRRQVGATAAWQAVTLATLALVIGVPLGIVGGRWAWTSFAGGLGVGAGPRVPAGWLALLVPATGVLALAIAALPARAAARTRPAVVLRTE